jgi:tripartite-type tricarboxylate transporter receptor subunit TctC
MAQGSYPSKTVLMIVPAAAGGTTDLAGRMAAQALAPVIGQSVVVDNKGGGNGAIAPIWSSVPMPTATRC